MESSKKIYFKFKPSTRVRPENTYLSNFSSSQMTIDGVNYPTVEHYYQGVKVKERSEFEFKRVLDAPTPLDAKRVAMRFAKRDKPANPEYYANWLRTNVDVMRVAVKEKFAQNEDLKMKLLATGD